MAIAQRAAGWVLHTHSACTGRPLGCPHAPCQLHTGRCPDALTSPCAVPAADRWDGEGDAQRAGRRRTAPCCPCPHASTQWDMAPCCRAARRDPQQHRCQPQPHQLQATAPAAGMASQSYGCAEIQRWEGPYCSPRSILS